MANGIITNSESAWTPKQQQQNSDNRASIRPKPDDAARARFGKIVAAKQFVTDSGLEQVVVEIVFDDEANVITKATYKRYFMLEEPIDFLALVYGDLEDLVGLPVVIHQRALRKDIGIARIINRHGAGNMNTYSTIAPFATALAPAD